MTKWRRHKIVFTTDIEKMFRQIDVCPSHRKFQQILWRFNPFDEISLFELNTVTYGTTSAPYLAIRVLRQLAHDFEGKYPKAAQVLRQDSYVDDIISGSDALENVITLAEINKTLIVFVKLTQKIDFPNEFAKLSSTGEVKHSPILKLMPFLDEDGLIRVGGRLQNSNFPYDVKHPLILSKTNPLSLFIIADSHEKTLLGGLTLTMSYVNRKFWIVSGNQIAKRVIQKCIKCFRYAAKTSQQIMGNLQT